MNNPRTLVFLCALLATVPATQANVLLNGDFSSPSILGAGQTEVAPGKYKLTIDSPATADYKDAISGIAGWTYGLDRVYGPYLSTDIGIENGVGHGDGNASRKLAINRWNRPVSQSPVGARLVAGFTYTLHARSYMEIGSNALSKVGVLSLYAGVYQNGNPSDFGSVPLLGVSRMVSQGSANAFGDPVNNHVTLNGRWYDHTISYTVLPGDAKIGAALSVTMLTANGSYGKTYWDDVSLTATPVPEPASLTALGLGALTLSRRRKAA